MFYDCGGSPGWLPLELVEVSQALVSLIRTNSKISTSRPHVGNFGCLIFNFRFYFLTFRIANVIVSTTIEYQSCHMVMCWRRNFFLHLVLPSLVERACVVALFLLGDGKCALDKHTHIYVSTTETSLCDLAASCWLFHQCWNSLRCNSPSFHYWIHASQHAYQTISNSQFHGCIHNWSGSVFCQEGTHSMQVKPHLQRGDVTWSCDSVLEPLAGAVGQLAQFVHALVTRAKPKGRVCHTTGLWKSRYRPYSTALGSIFRVYWS